MGGHMKFGEGKSLSFSNNTFCWLMECAYEVSEIVPDEAAQFYRKKFEEGYIIWNAITHVNFHEEFTQPESVYWAKVFHAAARRVFERKHGKTLRVGWHPYYITRLYQISECLQEMAAIHLMGNEKFYAETQSDRDEITLKELYGAINRNDIPSAMQYFDEKIQRTEVEGFPIAGSFRGLSELESYLIQARDSWASGSCEPDSFLASGDRIIAFLYVHIHLKDHKESFVARTADVFTFKAGKITEMRSFLNRQDALEWVGVEDNEFR